MSENIQPKRPATTRLLIAALLAGTIVGGGSVVAIEGRNANAAEEATTASTAPVTPAPVHLNGFADLVATVKPAVVNIATTEKIRKVAQQMPDFGPDSPFGEMFRQFGQQQEQPRAQQALGSGFIIDPSGYIVTNNHVVDGATKVTVTMADGTTYPATVKGRDPKTDVALLKIEAKKPLPYVTFGDSDKAREGDWVIAVGNPFGLGGTVTAGIISAHGRNINSGPYDNFLQIDAPINPGNSGGPLFDQSGHVIGIDSAIYSPTGGSVGIGFAIPASTASKVVDQLREHGTVTRGWLGVQMQAITPDLAKALGRSGTDGVVIAHVEDQSPAEAAHLQEGDVVTAVNGEAIKGPRDLAMAVANVPSGTSAKFTLWRDGHEQTAEVKIGTQPGEKTAMADEGTSDNPIGLALAPMSSQARSQLGLDESAKGVVVERVAPDSRAADSGIQAGDVIVKVGNEAVTTPSEAAAKLHAAEKAKKDAVPLLVMRDGSTYYLALQLAAG